MKKRIIETEEQARKYAIEWQNWASEQNLSYGELSEWQYIFIELADRFGLKDEFEENGII